MAEPSQPPAHTTTDYLAERIDFWLLALLIVLAVLAWTDQQLWPVIANVAALVVLLLLRKRLPLGILSPVGIVAALYAGVGLAGYVLADALKGRAGGGMLIILPPELNRATAYLFALASILVVAGGCLATITGNAASISLAPPPPIRSGLMLALLGAALLPGVMIVGTLGTSLLSRPTYLAGSGGTNFFGLGQTLAIASVAIAGSAAFHERAVVRAFAWAETILFFCIFFGLGSRRLALVPVVFAVGVALMRPRRGAIALGVAGVLSAVLLPLPLYLRGGTSHGFLPYLHALGGYNLHHVDWLTTLNNVLISFPTVGATAFQVPRIPLANLWISLNPLPGSLAGWYKISDSMNLGAWTPYAAVGEAYNYGPPWRLLIWLFLGYVIGTLEAMSAKLAHAGLSFFALCTVGLCGLFGIQSLEYSLRTSTRMILYAAVLCGGVTFVRHVLVPHGAGAAADAEVHAAA